MKETIKITTGKTIEFPSRIYLKRDLDKMQLAFVEKKIFLNKAKAKEDFLQVSKDIKDNMAVINYGDYSSEVFSEKKLKNAVEKQLGNDCDFIILPYFKDESDHDVRIKIELAGNLKLDTDKDIILELSYKSNMSAEELANSSSNFDYLSIFYGTSYGHYPSFEKIARRIVSFKALTGKRVFCFAVPLKFSGAVIEDVRFMPCFDIICEAWIKNWRGGGGSGKIKVVDQQDFKSKNYEGWLSSGYRTNSLLAPINRTVFELFRDDAAEIRGEYESYIMDEVLTEIARLVPSNVMDYVNNKFHDKYFKLILVPYREKIIIKELRNGKEFKNYEVDDKMMIERKIREIFSPLDIERAINNVKELIRREIEVVPVQKIMEVIDSSRK